MRRRKSRVVAKLFPTAHFIQPVVVPGDVYRGLPTMTQPTMLVWYGLTAWAILCGVAGVLIRY